MENPHKEMDILKVLYYTEEKAGCDLKNIQYVGGLFSDTYRVHEHIHQTYELVYYTHGRGKVRIGEETVDFSPGVLTIIAPRIPHTDYADGGFQNLHVNIQHPGFPVSSHLVIHDSENRDIFKILFQIHSEYHYKRQNWEALVDSLYEVIHQYLLAFLQQTPMDNYVERVVHEIIQNISNPSYDIRETIRSLPYHPNYFRERFLKQVGDTPNRYLTKKRMENARELIRTRKLSGYSFQEIALLCGYQDAYYFSRLFRQYTGLSPRQWAAEYAQEQGCSSAGLSG